MTATTSAPPRTQPAPRTGNTPPADEKLAAALRREALALVEAIPHKIDAAPLNQITAALKTTVDLIRILESDDTSPGQSNPEQVIRWEFVYHGAVHDAPPWAADGDDVPGAVPGGGLRQAVGQNGAGEDSAA